MTLDDQAATEPRAEVRSPEERSLVLELERLRAAEAYRRHALRSLQEDMRTPLTPILLQLHLLESGRAGRLDDDARRRVEVLRRNVARWAATTERAIAVLADAGSLDPPALVDAALLQAEVAHEFATRALQEGIRLHPVAHGAPVPVLVPPQALRLALSQLLEHAITATPAGGDVAVSARRAGREAVLEVQDGGVGLSREELAAVRDPGGRVAGGTTHWAVPLLQVHLLVESLGGRLAVESEGKGEGVCRVLTLPVASGAL